MDILDFTDQFEKLIAQFILTQEKTEMLCEDLSYEDLLLSVTEDTSPPKWHLAHTSWFYAKFLLSEFSTYELPPEYDFLFNSYYQSTGPRIKKTSRRDISRPTSIDIQFWRQEVRDRVLELFSNSSYDERRKISKILELGINHEEQHHELLLMDIKRNFFESPLKPRYKKQVLTPVKEHRNVEWINIPSELVRIGVPLGGEDFHYDNESDSHFHWIDSFMLRSHPSTNEEYLSFVEMGGYQNPKYWHSDGWDILQKEGWSHPLYWEKRDDGWWGFSLWGMIPLDLKAPVCHLSYYEASAFSKFMGARLPTEFEWEAAAGLVTIEGDFFDSGAFEPQIPDGDESFVGIHGTVWEWTQSAYLPYPRYESYSGSFQEYNEKFMVNQMILRGGSCVTPKRHYRKTYRNFYYPHMRWQYSGVRLAKDLA